MFNNPKAAEGNNMGQCANLILQCMDYRIQKSINAWIDSESLAGNIDVVSIAGSCKNKEFALQNIAIAVEHHGVRRVFLTQHDDCAAYGGHAAYESLEAERAMLIADMANLKSCIERQHPDVDVIPLYIERHGTSWVVIHL